MRERMLTKVGVGSPEGQALLEKWGREYGRETPSAKAQPSGGNT